MNIDLPRRHLTLSLVLAAVSMGVGAAPAAPLIPVWKGPSCYCCKDWIAHLQKEGFQVQTHEVGNTDARKRLNMPDSYGSCHTAVIGGYAIEGHVPVREIKRLLKEKPAAVGLAVPGMKLGSPGMDTPQYGGRKQPYEVLLVLRDGTSKVFQTYD